MEREPWQDTASFQRFVQSWKVGQDELAARSTRGKAIVIPGSDHYIQLTQPKAVIAAILEVVYDVRATKTAEAKRRSE